MKKIMLITLIGMIFLIGMISSSSAMVQYFQTKMDMGNGTIKNHIFVMYDKENALSRDYVSGNNLYQVYILYNFYPQTWNSQNPLFKITSCQININYLEHLQNSSSLVFSQNYTQSDTDIMNAKYFIRMKDGDGFTADQICHFQNTSYKQLIIPAEMQVVTPTWECKECQWYEWSVQEKDIVKAQVIGDNVVTISTYIKKLISLNFEIGLAMFWVLMIILVFVSIGFIFILIYWLFLYLRSVTK